MQQKSSSLHSQSIIPLRDLHTPTPSVLSSDLDHLLSDDEAGDSDFSDYESEQYLHQRDGGRAAWLCLAGCWLVEAMIFGIIQSFGVFQAFYTTHPKFKDSKLLPIVGTLALGISDLGMPIVTAMNLRWPHRQKSLVVYGWLICIMGLLGASLASQVWHLIVFQGLLVGIGAMLAGTSYIFVLNQWFFEKRGLAYGILFTAGGVSGLFIPLSVRGFLNHGYGAALQGSATALTVIGGIGLLFFMRPNVRSQTAKAQQINPRISPGFHTIVRNPEFLVFAMIIFFQSLGSLLVPIFIPPFADSLSLAPSAGAGLLTLLNISTAPGLIILGYLSDRTSPYPLTSAMSLVSGLATLLLWVPATSMLQLVPYAIIFALTGNSFYVLLSRIPSYLTGNAELNMTVFGIFSFVRGVAGILDGPISAYLIRYNLDTDSHAEGDYQNVIWFAGLTMLLSSSGIVALFWKRPRK